MDGTDIAIANMDSLEVILLGAAVGVVLLFALLIQSMRNSARAARAIEPLTHQMSTLGQVAQQLSSGQEALRGNLQTVSDTQANAQLQILQTMEARLGDVQQRMNDRLADNAMRQARAMTEMQERMTESLHGNAKRTATSLTQLQERLAVIDKAQDNITKLSGDVLSLQDILSNNQNRLA